MKKIIISLILVLMLSSCNILNEQKQDLKIDKDNQQTKNTSSGNMSKEEKKNESADELLKRLGLDGLPTSFYNKKTELIELPDGHEIKAEKNVIVVSLGDSFSVSDLEDIVNKSREYGKIVAFDKDLLMMWILIKNNVKESKVITEFKRLNGIRHVGVSEVISIPDCNDGPC